MAPENYHWTNKGEWWNAYLFKNVHDISHEKMLHQAVEKLIINKRYTQIALHKTH